MKKIIFIALLVLSTSLKAQESNDEQIIKAVKLETDKIFLNNQLAYNYSRVDNDFVISTLDGKEFIKGSISSDENGNFSSIITFVTVGKKFSNKKIIGRKEIIFALCENNVLKENFEINELKLTEFFQKFNELK